MKHTLPLIFGICGFHFSSVSAADWPNWRGPNYDGSSAETGLPTKFSGEDNVEWAIDLPGIGSSSPIVWEDSVFITSVDEDEDAVVALKVLNSIPTKI